MAKDLLRERLAKYIPPKDQWTPVDEALYGVDDIYNVPEEKARKLREKAIRYSFKHHYENNKFYHEYCKDQGVTPDDIKTEEDFVKIPLIPDTFFKSYPDIEKDNGKGFLEWLEKIYTGEFPKIDLKKKKPSYDETIEAFWQKRLWINFSTTTTGRCTFLPKDWLTYSRASFAVGYHLVNFMFPPYDKETLEPFTKEKLALISTLPNPTKTMHTTKMLEAVLSDVFGEHEKIFLVDMPVTTDLIRISMSGETRGLKERAILGAAALSQKRFVSKCIKSLRRWEREGKQILFFGFPFGMDAIISAVEKKGLKFNFSGLGFWTVGGWKTYAASLDPEDFRKKGKELFGLSQDCHIDVYMMTEINACIIECKSHYKHIPYLFQPYVLDEEGNPLPPGEYGRFAFLDPLANSYPGFIVTNDRVKLLEHCPGCSRSSLVLSSDISRLKSAEPKGCAAAMGKMLSKAEGMGKEE